MDRVVLAKGRTVGVEVDGEVVTAREVILAAGSPLTPTLLLRSGIGPTEALRAAGVQPRVDLPGVGCDLYDQPAAVVPATPAPGAVTEQAPLTELFGRLDAMPGHDGDHAFYLTLFTGPPAGGTDPLIALMVGDLNPRSRGRCTITSADPADPPRIDLGFYTEDGDLARMRSAYRHAWAIAHHAALTRLISGFDGIDEDLVATIL